MRAASVSHDIASFITSCLMPTAIFVINAAQKRFLCNVYKKVLRQDRLIKLAEDHKDESRMPQGLFWSIKIEDGKAFIYLGEQKLKQHKEYEKVLRVEKSAVKGKDALLVRANLFNDTFYFLQILDTICNPLQVRFVLVLKMFFSFTSKRQLTGPIQNAI